MIREVTDGRTRPVVSAPPSGRVMLWAVALLGVGTAGGVCRLRLLGRLRHPRHRVGQGADLLHTGFPRQASGGDTHRLAERGHRARRALCPDRAADDPHAARRRGAARRHRCEQPLRRPGAPADQPRRRAPRTPSCTSTSRPRLVNPARSTPMVHTAQRRRPRPTDCRWPSAARPSRPKAAARPPQRDRRRRCRGGRALPRLRLPRRDAAAARHRAGRRRHRLPGHRPARPRHDRGRLRADARHA